MYMYCMPIEKLKTLEQSHLQEIRTTPTQYSSYFQQLTFNRVLTTQLPISSMLSIPITHTEQVINFKNTINAYPHFNITAKPILGSAKYSVHVCHVIELTAVEQSRV